MRPTVRHAHLVLVIALATSVVASADGRPADASLPVHRDVALSSRETVVDGRVPARSTLAGVLAANGLSTDLVAAIVDASRRVFDPRRFQANQPYRVERSASGMFDAFEYDLDAIRYLRVSVGGSGAATDLDAVLLSHPTSRDRRLVSADIETGRSSLTTSLAAAGENIDLALRLAAIFGGEIDFNTGLQPGDRIHAVVERVLRDGRLVAYDGVDAAVIDNAGHRIIAIPFTAPDGSSGWYDEAGRSLKRAFLKSPLPFEPRVTSAFSLHRVHPIYGDVRAHLGVDYGAPAGTSVVAVAAGTVESAAWAGDAGRMVVIRHAGGYETLYLHLSSFAPGLRAGARVDQGTLIGRVGSSGAATGPHLDFRIKRNGAYVDPVAEIARMPKSDPLPATSMPAFDAARDRALAALDGKEPF